MNAREALDEMRELMVTRERMHANMVRDQTSLRERIRELKALERSDGHANAGTDWPLRKLLLHAWEEQAQLREEVLSIHAETLASMRSQITQFEHELAERS